LLLTASMICSLTSGSMALGPTYAPRIFRIWSMMVTWSLRHPAGVNIFLVYLVVPLPLAPEPSAAPDEADRAHRPGREAGERAARCIARGGGLLPTMNDEAECTNITLVASR